METGQLTPHGIVPAASGNHLSADSVDQLLPVVRPHNVVQQGVGKALIHLRERDPVAATGGVWLGCRGMDGPLRLDFVHVCYCNSYYEL